MPSEAVRAAVAELTGAMRPGVTIADQRATYDRVFAQYPLPEGTRIEPIEAGGRPAEWVSTPASGDRVILYLHGGGYLIGSIAAYRGLGSRLATAAGARVLNLEYRLAPEHRHPAPVEDATAAYRWLLDQGIPAGAIAIAGDSAGGGLALGTLLALRDAGTPLPAAGIGLSAWTDMTGEGESMTSRAAIDPWVAPAGLRAVAKLFLNGADPRDPLASPLHGDLRGLPPLLLQVGGLETLYDDTRRFAEKAKAAGADVTMEEVPEMVHVFQMFAAVEPEGQAAIDRIGEFVKKHAG